MLRCFTAEPAVAIGGIGGCQGPPETPGWWKKRNDQDFGPLKNYSQPSFGDLEPHSAPLHLEPIPPRPPVSKPPALHPLVSAHTHEDDARLGTSMLVSLPFTPH